jgi:hypothetical protein
MPKYMIERAMPGAGDLTAQQLQAASQTSCAVLAILDRKSSGWNLRNTK